MAHAPKTRWMEAILDAAEKAETVTFPWTRGARTGAWKASFDEPAEPKQEAAR